MPNSIVKTGLTALIEKANDHGYWLLDLEHGLAHDIADLSGIEPILKNGLSLLLDAKSSLKKWQIEAKSNLRIICLTTVKKLISGDINQTLNVPEFSTSLEALAWVTRAVTDAFDRIAKLDLNSLVALECQVIVATLAMERKGLPFHKTRWLETLTRIEHDGRKIKERLNSLLVKSEGFMLFGPEPVDLNNASSVKESLEQLLGQKLDGTSQSSLKGFDHEAVKLLLSYREHARMLSTYGESFLEKIDNNRLYGSFVPLGSPSGRFACHEPNLLALPHHPDFQACLEPESPYKVIHFDFSAFELRILAALSGEQSLMEIFNDRLDIHSMVAQEIFKTTVSKTHNVHLRDQAKILNFGLIYGMGEQSLAKKLAISLHDAKKLFERYFTRFTRVADFLHSLERAAQKNGYAITALGRRATLSLEKNSDRGHLARVARNIPIQGTGADIVKLALCRVFRTLEQTGIDAHLINVVHDELVIEHHERDSEPMMHVVMEEMQAAFNAILPQVSCEISCSN